MIRRAIVLQVCTFTSTGLITAERCLPASEQRSTALEHSAATYRLKTCLRKKSSLWSQWLEVIETPIALERQLH
jgi:hypothetical protein